MYLSLSRQLVLYTWKNRFKLTLVMSMRLSGLLTPAYPRIKGNIWYVGRAILIMRISGSMQITWKTLKRLLQLLSLTCLGRQDLERGVVLGFRVDITNMFDISNMLY